MNLLAIFAAAAITVAMPAATVPSPFPQYTPVPRQVDATNDSMFLPMRDGVRLAVEVLRPTKAPAGARLPTIVRFTRYGRTPRDGSITPTDGFWVLRNYAVVAVDQRGTGSSFGRVRYGKAELDDMRTVLDWVVAQRWSNGRVAAIGASYEGTTAELLAATGHPAVRAVAPLYSDYDYFDLFRPGGVLDEGLAAGFSQITAAMDAGEVAAPVEGDRDNALVRAAVAEHRANPDLAAVIRANEFADENLPQFGAPQSDLATAGSHDALAKANVPELIVTSWYDAAVAQGVLRRYAELPVPQRVIISATNHGGSSQANPYRALAATTDGTLGHQYRLAEAFFRPLLVDDTPPPAPQSNSITYFTVGENVWHTTETWPPAGLSARTWYLAHDGHLTPAADSANTQLPLDLVTTGAHNRWYSQMTGEEIALAEIAQGVAQAPSFTTEPLPATIEITGTPVLRLTMSASIADPSLFAYLLAVAPDGTTIDLTQGELRLLHRKLDASNPTLHTFARRDAQPVAPGTMMDVPMALLPLSATVPKGYRLRIAFAAGEKPAFVTAGPYAATVSGMSRLDVPSRERSDLDARQARR